MVDHQDEEPRWMTLKTSDFVHVMPLSDLHPHVGSVNCECSPTQDSEFPSLYVHHSYDFRELGERIQELRQEESDRK